MLRPLLCTGFLFDLLLDFSLHVVFFFPLLAKGFLFPLLRRHFLHCVYFLPLPFFTIFLLLHPLLDYSFRPAAERRGRKNRLAKCCAVNFQAAFPFKFYYLTLQLVSLFLFPFFFTSVYTTKYSLTHSTVCRAFENTYL
jgi:hypothetical protein